MRRGSCSGSIARDFTSGPSTGSALMRVHVEGSRRRATNTYWAVPPMRCSIVSGVILVYVESACAKAVRSSILDGHAPTVTARNESASVCPVRSTMGPRGAHRGTLTRCCDSAARASAAPSSTCTCTVRTASAAMATQTHASIRRMRLSERRGPEGPRGRRAVPELPAKRAGGGQVDGRQHEPLLLGLRGQHARREAAAQAPDELAVRADQLVALGLQVAALAV